ncbi:hypothetical protein MKW98_023239 [Papaver atlanticum]|uniref:Uncharacterized protein n=1 Tax=Papaver atlanticum TaxID=357466 RepID=A0AAD4T9R9_9MAGN|nr:hypothetical protein MKW98_023239 [Papaver atlanticum]
MEHLCPMGDNGTYITKYISHLANDGHKLPLTIDDWKRMPSQLIENVVLEIKQIFEYPEVLDGWIDTKINDRWKDHKFHVKKAAYTKWNTVEERLANPPHDVVESQWMVLVEVWNTDLKKQAICQINKENREKQKFHNTTSSKPHAKCAAEKKTEDPDEVLMDPEVAAELKEMEEVEIKASLPGNGIKPKNYWGEESSTNPTTDPNAEIVNLIQQLENIVAQLQVAMQQIADLEELLVAHDELGTVNTVTPSNDAKIRNSP